MSYRYYNIQSDFEDHQIRSLGSLFELFGRYTGLINSVLERDDLKDFDLHWFQCLTANASLVFGTDKEISSGGLGIDEDRDLALLKCFAEGIERYALSNHNDGRTVKLKIRDLPLTNLNLLKLSFNSLDLDKVYSFIKVKSYKTPNEIIFWPADKVYVGFKSPKIGEYSTSTGVSFHKDKNQAIISSILEIIERDAIISNHYLIPEFLEIDPLTIKSSIVNKVSAKGYDLRIMYLFNSFNLPIFLTFICKATNDGLRYGIGCSANFNSLHSIEKSIKEALFTQNYAGYLMHLRQNNVELIDKLYEHFLYYQGDNYKHLVKHYKKIKLVNYDDLKFTNYTKNKELVDLASKEYGDILSIDITPNDIRKRGFWVIKAIAPGALDIHTRELYLNRESTKLNLAMDRFRSMDINTLSGIASIPHPMP